MKCRYIIVLSYFEFHFVKVHYADVRSTCVIRTAIKIQNNGIFGYLELGSNIEKVAGFF